MNETNFNKLTPAETERLAILAEECAEVVVIVNKILRHGYYTHDPDHPERGSNMQMLEIEMGDVRYAIIEMCTAGDVSKDRIHRRADQKKESIKPWLHHQPE